MLVDDVREKDNYVSTPVCELDRVSTRKVFEAFVLELVQNELGRFGSLRDRLFRKNKVPDIAKGTAELDTSLKLMVSCRDTLLKRYRPRFENRLAVVNSDIGAVWNETVLTCHDVFADGEVTVARIMAYIAFICTVISRLMQFQQFTLMEEILQKSIDILDYHAGNWVIRNGGWSLFIAELRTLSL